MGRTDRQTDEIPVFLLVMLMICTVIINEVRKVMLCYEVRCNVDEGLKRSGNIRLQPPSHPTRIPTALELTPLDTSLSRLLAVQPLSGPPKFGGARPVQRPCIS